jgi:hypothetical protein
MREGSPVDAATVVLHRVGAEEAGEIDSVRASAHGGFSFHLPRVPDPGRRSVVYFASVRHQGILYFGPPITTAIQLDSLYVIQVYDTVYARPGGESFPVAVRNLFLEPGEDSWNATDLLQVRNEGQRTVVALDQEPSWVYPLPANASDLEVGQSDLAPDAVALEGSDLRVFAPVPPGERLLLVRYRLPGPEITLPLPGRTERVEVLIREPAPPLDVSVLQGAPPVELEPGTSYRRFTGSNLGDATVAITLGEAERSMPVAWFAVVLAILLAVVGTVAVRRSRSPTAARTSAPGTREGLLGQVAQLDEDFSRVTSPGAEVEAEYRERRAALLDALRRHR